MPDITQAHVVAVEVYANATACEVAAVQLDAQHYPGESMATQSRRYRKAQALHAKAEAWRKVGQLAEALASGGPNDTVTFTINKGKGATNGDGAL